MMRKTFIAIVILVASISATFASEALNPTITPALFKPNTAITVTYDVTGTSLEGLSEAYVWVWIPNKNIDAKFNINPGTSAASAAKFAKSVVNGRTLFTITFTPTDFFATQITNETQLGMLLKGKDWSNGQTTDFIASFWDGSFQIKLNSPSQRPLFVNTNDVVHIDAVAPVAADYELFVDDVSVDQQTNVEAYQFDYTVTDIQGGSTIRVVATSGNNTSEASFQFVVRSSSPVSARPAGIISGINYNAADPSRITLCLLAPGKSSVYVRGDFSDWNVLPENLMNHDGEYFWIELTGLASGVEYGFQYVVDETLFLADPYADKILDPDDKFIPESTYPNLKPFPQKALSNNWYFNRVAIFQTAQQPYSWKANDFQRPENTDLVIYELLIRDFFDEDHRSYQNLTDTIRYFKSLGVNAIELMPIMEFNGNDSWGYNPTFMFAPDKYYGPKNSLKEFVDECHAQDIAVILDIAMNHHDMPNPYVLMDFDFTTNTPKSTNKWFNQTATHPFSVFFDMNHESLYTKKYLDTVNYYWLNEYQVDGFRYDLSKGFTQKNNPDDVAAWSAKDDSRIAILERMGQKVWSHSPEAILILEHFADNSEEMILSDFGFMPWGNINYAFAQNTKGASTDSDISGASYKTRSWTKPNLVDYMESHDEERMMYRNLTEGAFLGSYNVKNLATGLNRTKAAATLFFSIPGPKMIWEFEELGYDVSINENGRTGTKPLKWNYYSDTDRKGVYDHFSEMIFLKTSKKIFETSDFVIQGGASLQKQVVLKNSPYKEIPVSEDEMNAVAVANFGLTAEGIDVNFPHKGKWYSHFDNKHITVDQLPYTVILPAGGYKLYTDYDDNSVTATEGPLRASVFVYPNPAQNSISISAPEKVLSVSVILSGGQKIEIKKMDESVWDISTLKSGFHIIDIQTVKTSYKQKLIKH
jgi:hypothetical protein